MVFNLTILILSKTNLHRGTLYLELVNGYDIFNDMIQYVSDEYDYDDTGQQFRNRDGSSGSGKFYVVDNNIYAESEYTVSNSKIGEYEYVFANSRRIR